MVGQPTLTEFKTFICMKGFRAKQLIRMVIDSAKEEIKTKICEHDFQADTQITFIKCKKCDKVYYCEKNVNIFNK